MRLPWAEYGRPLTFDFGDGENRGVQLEMDFGEKRPVVRQRSLFDYVDKGREGKEAEASSAATEIIETRDQREGTSEKGLGARDEREGTRDEGQREIKPSVETSAGESGKIEDFGEKLEGARKDALRDFARTVSNTSVQTLIEQPMSKAFKRPDLKRMVEHGAITEEEALMAEAILSGMIYAAKKPTLTRRSSSKAAIRTWAEDTHRAIVMLGEMLSGDPARKESAMEAHKKNLEEKLKEKNAHVDRLRTWNSDHEIPYFTEVVDPIEVMAEVLRALGHRPGEKLVLPLTHIENDWSGHYVAKAPGKGGSLWFRSNDYTKEEAIKTMVLAARIARGDTDVELPAHCFHLKGVGARLTEESGKWEVLYWGGRGNTEVRSKVFDNKEEAEAFAKKHNTKVMPEHRYTGEYSEGFELNVTDPVSGYYYGTGRKFANRDEARAWMDENYDTMNREGVDKLMSERGAKSERKHFFVTTHWEKGKRSYLVMEDDPNNPWPFMKVFDSKEAAETWLKGNIDRLEKERGERRNMGKGSVYYNPITGREGRDWRSGKDATPEMYEEAFGFRGVQFGNWTNAKDRQTAMNQAYDALMDLAELLGISSRALSLDGELGLAFGSRGSGWASAHYETGNVVINLTKTRGAGTLAHEWFHALDNYLSRKGGNAMGYATDRHGRKGMNSNVAAAIDRLARGIHDSAYGRRSIGRGEYWGRTIEMAARLFETWVSERIKERGGNSSFLASGLNPDIEASYRRRNYQEYRAYQETRAKLRGKEPEIMSEEEFNQTEQSLKGYPYPTRGEMAELGKLVDDVMEAVREREEETGSMAGEVAAEYGRQMEFDFGQEARPSAVERSLFDYKEGTSQEGQGASEKGRGTSEKEEEQGDVEREMAAEAANGALERFYPEYGDYWVRARGIESEREALQDKIEALRAVGGAESKARIEELEAEVEALADAEKLNEEELEMARGRLEAELLPFYEMENTPEDAKAQAREMANRAMAEIEVRIREQGFRAGQRERARKRAEQANAERDERGGTSEEGQARSEEREGAREMGREAKAGEVRSAQGPIGYEAVGHLPDTEQGEFCHSERQYLLTGRFSFTGSDRVESHGDVAYIMRSLEGKATEHVFAVLVKDGKARIVNLGQGGPTMSIVDFTGVRAGYDAFGADEVYIVHNHPSGVLRPSQADEAFMRTAVKGFEGKGVKVHGMIIDTDSGRYKMFGGTDGEWGEYERRGAQGARGEKEYEVADFSEAVNRPDREGAPAGELRSGDAVAQYIRGLRFGRSKRVSYLIVQGADGKVVGNIHTDYESVRDSGLAEEIASAAVKYRGQRVIIYGDVDIENANRLRDKVAVYSFGSIDVVDAVRLTDEKSGGYEGAHDEGWISREASSNYGFSSDRKDFEAKRDRAITDRGTVVPGLAEKEVEVVQVEKHPFKGASPIKEAKIWAIENIVGEHELTDSNGETISYNISKKAVKEYLSGKTTEKSAEGRLDVHLSALTNLPEIISKSIEAEVHADYQKDDSDQKRSANSTVSPGTIIHRFYGAINIDGVDYRVKTTIKEKKGQGNKAYSYEVTKIELLEKGSSSSLEPTGSISASTVGAAKLGNKSGTRKISGEKLLAGVEKSHDKGKLLLEESRKKGGYEAEASAPSTETGMAMEPSAGYGDEGRGGGLRAAVRGIEGDMGDAWRGAEADRAGATPDSGSAPFGIKELRKAAMAQRGFDRETAAGIADLGRALIEGGGLDLLKKGEVKRLLSMVKNSVGVTEAAYRKQVNKVIDILIDNQERMGQEAWEKLLKVRGDKDNALGVKVQGALDVEGQRVTETLKRGLKMDAKQLNEAETKALDKVSEGGVRGDEGRLELAGYDFARRYKDAVDESERQEADLKDEIEAAQAQRQAGSMSKADCDAFLKSAEESLRSLRIERAEKLQELVGDLAEFMQGSADKAKAWKEEQTEHDNGLRHMANSDLEGVPYDSQRKDTFRQKAANWSVNRLVSATLPSFDAILKALSPHSSNGEGYLYNYFMRGWNDAAENEYQGKLESFGMLDAQAEKLFGWSWRKLQWNAKSMRLADGRKRKR